MKPKKNELVVFELVGSNASMYDDPTGKRKISERPFGIPAEAVCMFPHEDEEGDVFLERRKIRYVRTENSPFVDEQNIDSSLRITRLVSKPNFTAGILVVKPSQRNLLEFLRHHPANEANKHWGLEGQKTLFREKNYVADAQKANENTKKILEAGRLVYESNFTSDILPIARYLRYDTSADKDILLFQVKQYAEANPDEFIKLLGSAVVSRFSMIQEAEAMGIINVTPTRVTWADGRQIIQVPANFDAYEYFAEICFDPEYRSTWLEVKRLLAKMGNSDNDDVKIEKAETDQTQQLKEISTEELMNLLKDKKIITYQLGKGFSDEDGLIAKTKDELAALIERDKRVWAARVFE